MNMIPIKSIIKIQLQKKTLVNSENFCYLINLLLKIKTRLINLCFCVVYHIIDPLYIKLLKLNEVSSMIKFSLKYVKVVIKWALNIKTYESKCYHAFKRTTILTNTCDNYLISWINLLLFHTKK